MNDTMTMLRKEWRCFVGSDRGIFLLYSVLVISWSLMLATPDTTGIAAGPIWLVFFSVVISANFSNTVFISERVSGILEILLTSGLSRKSILYGKMGFVAGMSIIIGLVCALFAPLWRFLIYRETGWTLGPDSLALYVAAVFMNTGCSAYLSVRMGNPRLLHLANLLLLAALMTAYTLTASCFEVPSWALSLTLLLVGLCATVAAQRLYESEKILQPVIF